MKTLFAGITFWLLAMSIVGVNANTPPNDDLVEAINTTEDLLEWINWDYEESRIDSVAHTTYKENLNELLNRLNDMK